jgi:hypothetical protein
MPKKPVSQIIKDSAVVGVATSTASTAVTYGSLWCAGFSAAGPVAGSIAAGAQAAVGNVAAGSGFAFCQTVAMTGFGTIAIPVVAVGATAGGGYMGYKLWRKNKEQ